MKYDHINFLKTLQAERTVDISQSNLNDIETKLGDSDNR